jgi:hypothetical protein
MHGLQGGDGRRGIEALGARRRAALDHPAPVKLVPPLRQRLDPLLPELIAASSSYSSTGVTNHPDQILVRDLQRVMCRL